MPGAAVVPAPLNGALVFGFCTKCTQEESTALLRLEGLICIRCLGPKTILCRVLGGYFEPQDKNAKQALDWKVHEGARKEHSGCFAMPWRDDST